MKTLRDSLSLAMEPRQIFHAPVWGNPRPMTEALRDMRRTLGGTDVGAPPSDVLQDSLRRFAMTQQVSSFTELKYLCHGLTVPVGESHWRLIDREPLFDKLLSLVDQRAGQPRQFRRCYHGLLNGYFGFDRHHSTPGSGGANWIRLRRFLGDRLARVLVSAEQRGCTQEWLSALLAHQNLLADEPCNRYARGLLEGNPGELKSICASLGIASTSWVWDEALMAYIEAVCASDDASFRRGMAGMLDIVSGRSELKLAQLFATRATSLIVCRYALCADRPEHPDLRDTSLHWIGNPWVDRTAWDAHVRDEAARQMIEGWLKRRLIKDFFELLAHDGGADLRRLNYWLKWEPQITDMWFVLGDDARRNRSEPFIDLRKRMVGRERLLEGGNDDNNAFVMRIGALLVIEFGVTGNACYVFAASEFNTSLDRKRLSIHELKQRAKASRLSHMHHWEHRFDFELRRLLQSVPISKGVLQQSVSPAQAATPLVVASGSTKSSESAGLRHGLDPAAQPPQPSPTSYRNAEPPVGPRALEIPRLGLEAHTARFWSAPPANAPRAARPASPSRPIVPSASQLPASPSNSSSAARTPRDEVSVESIRAACVSLGVEVEDNRAKNGAIWILIADRNARPGFARLLEQHGFQYTDGKGFWLKNKV